MNKKTLSYEDFSRMLNKLRERAPLIHCLSNDLSVHFMANVLLASGALPAMIVASEEVEEFVGMADNLLINVGTLDSTRALSMFLAVKQAQALARPWVLDPVAVGGLSFRSRWVDEYLNYSPGVIRGNASEIMTLATKTISGRGPESTLDPQEVLPYAADLAKRLQTIVSVSGKTDYITDGENYYALPYGHIYLTRVTTCGCVLGALVAAFVACCEDKLAAVAAAMAMMAIAGELAAKRCEGVGSFPAALLDILDAAPKGFADVFAKEKA